MSGVSDRFEGKVAVVTGAASGVGRATTLRMAAEGGKVFAVDRSADQLAEVAAVNPDAIAAGVYDITSRAACQAAVAEALARFGRLDILANVAGIARAHHVLDVTEDEWRAIMGVNVDGLFWMSQAAVPALLEADGCIVNVASNAGLMGQAYTVPYCSSKGAVIQLTRAMAMEFIKQPLRVNCVAPGGMTTALTETFQLPTDPDWSLMAPYTGFRGMGTADDASSAICWLASDEARRCTGTILSIDGGLTAG